MKRYFKLLTFSITLLLCCMGVGDRVWASSNALFVVGSTSCNINGATQTMDVAPYIKAGRTYMPIAYLAKALGVQAVWDAQNSTVTLIDGEKVLQMKIGSTLLIINGAAITMDVTPEITSGRTFLPAALVAQGFNCPISWNASSQTIRLGDGDMPDSSLNTPSSPIAGLLTPDYWIPDTSKTYIYDSGGGYPSTNNTHSGQKTVTWAQKSNGTYEKSWDEYSWQENGTLSPYGAHVTDTVTLKGTSVFWELNSGGQDQAGSWDESLAYGTKEVLRQVVPGQSWNNTFKTTLGIGDSGEIHKEKVTFIGMESINCLGVDREAARINVDGSYVTGQGTKYQSSYNYKVDYWLVKGIGIIKRDLSETGIYWNNDTSIRYETEQLVAIK
ncbi:MAG: copper amine oxidase N-terminal domain-containing protein [Syntrophomonas sp.]